MSAITHGWLTPEYVDEKAVEHRHSLGRALAACDSHGGHKVDPSCDILHEFVTAACACLHLGLSSGSSSAVQRGPHSKRPIENSAGNWPDAREDIFVYGEENTVVSILLWCYKIGAPDPMFLLTDMISIAHPMVVPEIMERDGLRKQLMLGIVKRVAEYRACKDGAPCSWGDAPLPPTQPRRRAAKMRAALDLLTSVISSPDALPNLLLLFARELEYPLFGLLNLVLFNMDPSDPLGELITPLAAIMYAVVPPLELPPCDEITALVASYETLTLFDVLHEMLRTCVRVRRLCYTCGRPAHAQDLEGDIGDRDTHFLACERCRLVRYCGRACQAAAWKLGEPVPHRAVCWLLARIHVTASPKLQHPEFNAALATLGFTEEEMRTLSLFTLNAKLAPFQTLFCAADIHRELFVGGQYPTASVKALANVAFSKG
ncbi:hypothetical protein AURDEDRAFT_177028 [Auricularia subglabra TFB-10046 SS5]|uniref:MYND-type domain-containing protein n=1 Tax=Auricularia subglabra (strain TFB-10046 / SS5) TaxID=717982 RepID=J0LBR6_AURST|nr:hypothetical protein AURDEDRAFT_177028 [Auricularia subglabra TFB-10046 SS5]